MSADSDAWADREALAGEYVLGLLDDEAMERVRRALAGDHALAQRVAYWDRRLEPASRLAPPVEPEAHGWERIASTLQLPGASASDAQVILLKPRRDGRIGARRPWERLPFWRGLAGLATAAALVLAVAPFVRGPVSDSATTAPQGGFVAVLQARDAAGNDGGAAGWIVRIEANRIVTSIPLGRVEAGEGRALQLWTLIDPAEGPISLGLVPGASEVRLPGRQLPAIRSGQLFEVTLEPEGGSPIGRPTGRVLFIGRASPVGGGEQAL
jgi:anti-sigma-K factor RskA